MHCTTAEEFAEWVGKSRPHGLVVDLSSDGSLAFEGGEAFAVEFPWPTSPGKLRYYAQIAAMVDTAWEDVFYGATLWLSLTDIWGHADRSGWRMVERMRLSFAEPRPLQTAPVHHFRNDELLEATAFLVPAFVYGWNAFYLNSSHDMFVHISHDEYWCVITRNRQTSEELLKIEGAKLEPRLLERFLR
jgi:hypothetical protein